MYVYLFISSAGFYCGFAESFGVWRATGRRNDRGFCPSPAVVSGTGGRGMLLLSRQKCHLARKGRGEGLCVPYFVFSVSIIIQADIREREFNGGGEQEGKGGRWIERVKTRWETEG